MLTDDIQCDVATIASARPGRRSGLRGVLRSRVGRVAVAAVLATGLLSGAAAAPANAATPTATAQWVFSPEVLNDGPTCRLHVHLPAYESSVPGTNNYYADVALYVKSGTGWVRAGYQSGTATQAVLDGAWREPYWNGAFPYEAGWGLLSWTVYPGHTWRFIGHNYWRKGSTVLTSTSTWLGDYSC